MKSRHLLPRLLVTGLLVLAAGCDGGEPAANGSTSDADAPETPRQAPIGQRDPKVPAPPAPEKLDVTLDTVEEKLSYAMGVEAGKRLRVRRIDHDVDAFIQGATDQVAGKELAFTEDGIRQIRTDFNEHYWATREEREERIRAKNREEGQAYLRALLGKRGIEMSEKGALYEIVRKGSGASPGPDDRVRLGFRAFRLNGLEFDSSDRRGGPEVVPVPETLAGMQEVLPEMKEGAVYRLYLPPYLAYGREGDALVEPEEAVIFELELLEVLPPLEEPQTPGDDGDATDETGSAEPKAEAFPEAAGADESLKADETTEATGADAPPDADDAAGAEAPLDE